jgi:hypothetical protein
MEKRFGPLPQSAKQRLDPMTASQLEEVALRILDSSSLEDFLG